nr:hypothetical protein [Parafrankia sp. EUN1f]
MFVATPQKPIHEHGGGTQLRDDIDQSGEAIIQIQALLNECDTPATGDVEIRDIQPPASPPLEPLDQLLSRRRAAKQVGPDLQAVHYIDHEIIGFVAASHDPPERS